MPERRLVSFPEAPRVEKERQPDEHPIGARVQLATFGCPKHVE